MTRALLFLGRKILLHSKGVTVGGPSGSWIDRCHGRAVPLSRSLSSSVARRVSDNKPDSEQEVPKLIKPSPQEAVRNLAEDVLPGDGYGDDTFLRWLQHERTARNVDSCAR